MTTSTATYIWQTTNQQPWVSALADGLITAKTRRSKPSVPVGATVLLHASKNLWPDCDGLVWAQDTLDDFRDLPRGAVLAVATVEAVGRTENILRPDEYVWWDVVFSVTRSYNSAAEWTVRFKDIVPLVSPIPARGFQPPFYRAKKETIDKILEQNPELRERLTR